MAVSNLGGAGNKHCGLSTVGSDGQGGLELTLRSGAGRVCSAGPIRNPRWELRPIPNKKCVISAAHTFPNTPSPNAASLWSYLFRIFRTRAFGQTQDENELIDYLMSRRRVNRATVEQYSVFHVIAYQRRLQLFKSEFLGRGATTPLGKPIDWWERACVLQTFVRAPSNARAQHVLV